MNKPEACVAPGLLARLARASICSSTVNSNLNDPRHNLIQCPKETFNIQISDCLILAGKATDLSINLSDWLNDNGFDLIILTPLTAALPLLIYLRFLLSFSLPVYEPFIRLILLFMLKVRYCPISSFHGVMTGLLWLHVADVYTADSSHTDSLQTRCMKVLFYYYLS